MRDKIREMKEYLDDGKGKDDNREPNIGIKLIKTFQRMTLIQEYYSQLIEDIENRIFSNYESSVYKESLTLLRDATAANIKVGLVLIFNRNCKQSKKIDKRITELKFKFPAFSILKDKLWLENKLEQMLNPDKCQDEVYYSFIYRLGEKLEKQFNQCNDIKNISPELHKLGKSVRKILTPSPPRSSVSRITLFTKKYIDTLQKNSSSQNSSNESHDLYKGKYQAYRELIKSYFGNTKDYMQISQLTDDGIDFLMDLALNEHKSQMLVRGSMKSSSFK